MLVDFHIAWIFVGERKLLWKSMPHYDFIEQITKHV